VPQSPNPNPRRVSLVFPILLVTIGALFLYSEFRPAFDPWPVLRTYWPLILIFVGIGAIWDSTRRRRDPAGASSGISVGSTIGIIAVALVLAALVFHHREFPSRHRRFSRSDSHMSQTVDRQGAQTVRAAVDMNAGDLSIEGGGSAHLLDATFDYLDPEGKPQVSYSVAGNSGSLSISQEESDSDVRIHTTSDNDWNLHLAGDIPTDLKVNMGAGTGNLRLRQVQLTGLEVQMGAGRMDIDLTGDRKKDLDADVEGGVGTATIHLPKNIGVVVNASGGLGAIDTHGFKHQDDDYVNDAYGKAPVTIHLKVQGGVGLIRLIQEP
jgi:hypothetical protein